MELIRGLIRTIYIRGGDQNKIIDIDPLFIIDYWY